MSSLKLKPRGYCFSFSSFLLLESSNLLLSNREGGEKEYQFVPYVPSIADPLFSSKLSTPLMSKHGTLHVGDCISFSENRTGLIVGIDHENQTIQLHPLKTKDEIDLILIDAREDELFLIAPAITIPIRSFLRHEPLTNIAEYISGFHSKFYSRLFDEEKKILFKLANGSSPKRFFISFPFPFFPSFLTSIGNKKQTNRIKLNFEHKRPFADPQSRIALEGIKKDIKKFLKPVLSGKKPRVANCDKISFELFCGIASIGCFKVRRQGKFYTVD